MMQEMAATKKAMDAPESATVTVAASKSSVKTMPLPPTRPTATTTTTPWTTLLAVAGVLVAALIIIVVVLMVHRNQQSQEHLTKVQVEWKNAIASLVPAATLADASTPQAQALDWLLHRDTTPNDHPTTTLSLALVIQRYALAVLYFATSGPASWISGSWLRGSECGTATAGAGATQLPLPWAGVSCHANRTVQALQLGTCVRCARALCAHVQVTKTPRTLARRLRIVVYSIRFSSQNNTDCGAHYPTKSCTCRICNTSSSSKSQGLQVPSPPLLAK
jgi:hypothetical protein